MTRLFAAFALPEDVRERLDRCVGPLRRSAALRWTRADQFHVTLAFFGDCDGATVRRLSHGVSVFDATDLHVGLSGFGWFGSHGARRVLWAGVVGDAAGLAGRHRAFCEAVGHEVSGEDVAWSPHVTLGRARERTGRPSGSLDDLAAEVERTHLYLEPFALGPVVLFASEQGPEGSRYVERARSRVT